ncbi:MAG: hypothetical protein OHK0046_25520 [Anaerolineae bacterium]
MDKTIVTALLIVISMVMAIMLFNIAYPAIVEGGEALNSMADQAEDRLRTQITIIHATAELDSNGLWQDTNANGVFDVFTWVKNTGVQRLIALDGLDVFMGPEGNFTRIPHESQAGGVYPRWSWHIENGTEWTPTATLRVTVHYQNPLAAGRYFVKVVLPNGIDSDTVFSL